MHLEIVITFPKSTHVHDDDVITQSRDTASRSRDDQVPHQRGIEANTTFSFLQVELHPSSTGVLFSFITTVLRK